MRAWQLDSSLMPGEDPAHIKEGDVEHWVAVYEELLAGNRRILQDLDSPAIEVHIRELEVGLAFWTRQLNRRESRSASASAVLALAAWADLRNPAVRPLARPRVVVDL
jgi:chromosome condensin MukBEF ATPase and DNA-binding subunit MukB